MSQVADDGRAKPYDLEERTLRFAKMLACLMNKLPRTMSIIEIGKQPVRSAGSVEANYIDAIEVLGKKNFQMRIKICCKEATESCYWLRLLTCAVDKDGNGKAFSKN